MKKITFKPLSTISQPFYQQLVRHEVMLMTGRRYRLRKYCRLEFLRYI